MDWQKIMEFKRQGLSSATMKDDDGKTIEIKFSQTGWYEGYY